MVQYIRTHFDSSFAALSDATAAPKPMAFFGRYLDVTPPSRLVWTNDESDDGAITKVTFEEKDGKTLLVLHEPYPCSCQTNAGVNEPPRWEYNEDITGLSQDPACQKAGLIIVSIGGTP